ncbi:hypothetical protein CBL_04759 [Carabus blaptoides fortunei]
MTAWLLGFYTENSIKRKYYDVIVRTKSNNTDLKPSRNKKGRCCLNRADIIKVHDGRSPTSPTVAMLCNEATEVEILSSSPDLFIEFVANSEWPGQGFKAKFEFQPVDDTTTALCHVAPQATKHATATLDIHASYPTCSQMAHKTKAPLLDLLSFWFETPLGSFGGATHERKIVELSIRSLGQLSAQQSNNNNTKVPTETANTVVMTVRLNEQRSVEQNSPRIPTPPSTIMYIEHRKET